MTKKKGKTRPCMAEKPFYIDINGGCYRCAAEAGMNCLDPRRVARADGPSPEVKNG